jgi:hypothetical protein
MNNEPLLNELRESLWRRKSAAGETERRARPEIAEEMQLESRLTEALAQMRDAPVASNFTARALQAIEREESRRDRQWSFKWRALLPRAAVAAAVLTFAGFAFHHHEVSVQREEVAKSVAMVAGAQTLPSVEALKNFAAIRRMSQATPRADMELIALAPQMQ